jgi:hypothetical protein
VNLRNAVITYLRFCAFGSSEVHETSDRLTIANFGPES